MTVAIRNAIGWALIYGWLGMGWAWAGFIVIGLVVFGVFIAFVVAAAAYHEVSKGRRFGPPPKVYALDVISSFAQAFIFMATEHVALGVASLLSLAAFLITLELCRGHAKEARL